MIVAKISRKWWHLACSYREIRKITRLYPEIGRKIGMEIGCKFFESSWKNDGGS